MSNKDDMSFRPKRPKDERDVLDLPKPPLGEPTVHERETITSEGSSDELEAIGRRHQGLDGKRYVGSYAVHVYRSPKILNGTEYIWLIQSTDLRELNQNVVILTVRELGRALMKRFGLKPPASNIDKLTRESERKLDA